MIEIVTDSTCDIPEPIAQSYKVTVIPAHLNIGQETYRDGVDISRQEFYQRLARERDLPRTSSPSPGAFIEVYRHLLGEAQYIVSVHVASTLSGIYNTARLAAEQLAPERILVVDSGQVTMGLGWPVLAAAEAVQSGEAVEGVLRAIQDTLERVRVFAIFDTLEFLARGGRVNLIQLGLSTLLKIKPMIELTKGRILSLGRMRTWSKAANALAERIVSLAPVEKLAVLHTNCLDCANDLRACIRDVLPAISAHSLTVEATTVIGTHVGPHALGVAAVTARRE